jgi:hypothetical protein
MKPSSAKAKGRTWQQEVRDKILNVFDTLEFDDVKSTSMGAGGEDVQLSPAARKLLPIQIECKRTKTLKTVYGWVEQAKTHGKHEPVVFVRADRENGLAICNIDHYFELQKKAGDNNGKP